ncbi:large conductance mechanosensitive channel protein MscL [Brachybacterium huguangmaarense]|uniref:Large-conductance mechanosensitive channel n=1 Tax=Brachybacterium huguangmaarense TaxID=1652028 RepID=A0ABY6G0B6_9MICO|nr:large conductance mechanosensitive channel protein MscL [Brachybacterium huguangmaarense]UYG16641.1 large conductance mechanosensitive channel protein MscL [Brachybacterium huguangmaarense]
MKGFKDFVMKGNVIDLAVGVVIGGAFTALITSIVDHLIQPVINVFGGQNVNGLAFQITNPKTVVDFGAILSAVISFLITAAVVYFVFVMPMAKARQLDRKRRGIPEEEESAAPEDVMLLTEIRDLLRAQSGSAPTDRGTGY